VSAVSREANVGVGVANRDCHAAYPGSRLCISTEILLTIDPPVPGEWARAFWDPVYDDRNGIDRTTHSTTNCYGITSTGFTGGVSVDPDGRLVSHTCVDPQPFACCAPVE